IESAANLTELQIELLRLELREWLRGKAAALGAMVLGAALVSAAFPVLLLSFGYGLVELGGMPIWASLLIAAAVGIMLAAAVVAWAILKIRGGPDFLRRSQEEFLKNIRWIERAITKPARAATADRNGVSTSV